MTIETSPTSRHRIQRLDIPGRGVPDNECDRSILGRSVLWPEAWASNLAADAEVVEVVLLQSELSGDHESPEVREATVTEIRYLLDRAVGAACRDHQRRHRSLIDRWFGTSVETGYAFLHRAKTLLGDVVPARELDPMLADMLARLSTAMPAGDARHRTLDKADLHAAVPMKRAVLRRATHLFYEIMDAHHARIRQLRNLLLFVSVVMATFVGITTVVVSFFPVELPLCFSGNGTSQPFTICPAGADQPSSADVFLVVGLGVLGGALAAAVAIRKLQPTSETYDVPLALALLKLPTGALTALAGILMIGGSFVPGLSDLDSQQQILAYAIVFGYAQQLATRLVDDRARAILSRLPERAPGSDSRSARA